MAEGPPTLSTLKGLLPCVDPLVLDKVGAAPEGLPTGRTHVRLLARVDSLVLGEVGAAPEGLPTLNAFVGLLAHMGLLVLFKAGALAGLPTLRRHMQLLPMVGELVLEEDCVCAKEPSTLVTDEGLVSRVHCLMLSKIGVSLEGFPTLAAYERAFSHMKSCAAGQVQAAGQALYATWMGPPLCRRPLTLHWAWAPAAAALDFITVHLSRS